MRTWTAAKGVLWGGMAALFLCAGTAPAHHAMEYIEMESYSTAKRGEKVFHLRYDYMVNDGGNPDLDHWEFTPGLSYGITDRLMADIHAHFAKLGSDHVVEESQAEFEPNGPSPFMEAVALCLQYRLTQGWPVDAAVSGTWEIPFGRAEELLGSEDYVCAGTLILSREFGEHGNVCANFTYEVEGDEDEWGWALGVKNPISADPHGISAGVELMGDFDGTRWSVLPGVYAPISETIILKTGIEIGQEKGEEDRWADTLRANVSLMYRF
ncbi:MAG: hypothetical protein QME60_04100 [Verrucomicrobiota bacterium]|nr:hypothetical protein [Verrucomicrobiota bacterium]